jgi:hypothetical protein
VQKIRHLVQLPVASRSVVNLAEIDTEAELYAYNELNSSSFLLRVYLPLKKELGC